MLKNFLCLISLVLITFCNAQGIQNLPSLASNTAMGSCSASFKDLRSVFASPAGISYSDQIQSAIYVEQRFGINELKSFSGAFLLPTTSGNFAVSISRFGFNLYNESLIGLTYARSLFKDLSIGGSLQYQSIHIEEYGSKSVLGFQIGSALTITKNTSLYLSLQNLHRPHLNAEDRLPAIFTLGLSYDPSDLVSLHTEIYKELDYKEDLRFGIEYKPSTHLLFRIGGHTYPTQLSFGFGVKILKSIYLEASTQYHTVLGFSPGMGLSYGIIDNK